jgi:hypothetical protein
MTCVVPPLTVIASLAAELATSLILETDTLSELVVLPIGGDTLIGSSGGALFNAWDFPLSFVGRSRLLTGPSPVVVASLTAELATLLILET